MTNDPLPPSKMTISTQALKPRTAGATRATLALLISIVALAVSGYQLWLGMDEKEGKIVSPLIKQAAQSDIESRLKAQENTLTVMNDTFKKQLEEMQHKLDQQAAPKPEAPDMGNTTAIQAKMATKMDDLEKQNVDLRQQIKSELMDKSKNITALSLLEHISRKAQMGLVFQQDVKALEKVVISNDASAHAYNLLKGFEKPLTSDTALIAGLNQLIPDFLAREKLDKADGFFDKIGIQLQKLVVVRRKNGQVSDETPIGKSLDDLQTAIISGDWPKATAMVAALGEKGNSHLPKDFASWQDKLRDRALAEEAVSTLRTLVLGQLQGAPAPVNPVISSPTDPQPDHAP